MGKDDADFAFKEKESARIVKIFAEKDDVRAIHFNTAMLFNGLVIKAK